MKENMLNKFKNHRNIWMVIALAATILRIGLFVRYPYFAIGDSFYDDIYLLQRAQSILSGEWLGAYNYVTLIKGASFPLFIVLSNILCMPYSMLLGLFYVVSAGVFCMAMRYITKKEWLGLVCYLYLLFSPIGFDVQATQRLYRNAIIFPSVLLVLGCVLLVYYKRNEKISKQLPWLVFMGISFSFFYYIREDSIWLLPLFVCALVITAIWYIWFSGYDKQTIIKRCVCLLLPIGIFMGTTGLYQGVNRLAYGVSNINDRAGGSFADLTGNMIQVQDTSGADLDYWIPREKLERIIEECPSLAEYKDMILRQYDAWASSHPEDNGNVRGDWSVWAFREACNAVGVYADARTQEIFFRTANEELLLAVEEGRLSFDNALHFTTQSRGIYPQELVDFTKETVKNAFDVLTFKDVDTYLIESSGNDHDIRFMESITGVKTIRPPVGYSEVYGWVIVRNHVLEQPVAKLLDMRSGEYVIDDIPLHHAEDVAAVYPDEVNTLRFAIDANSCIDLSQTQLVVFDGDQIILAEPLETTTKESHILYFDSLISTVAEDYNAVYSKRAVNMGVGITQIYQKANPLVLLLALMGYVMLWIRFIRERCWSNFEPVIILSGILLSLAIIEFGVTVFNSWLGAVWFYSCGAVPMGQSFVVMSLLYLLNWKQRSTKCTV